MLRPDGNTVLYAEGEQKRWERVATDDICAVSYSDFELVPTREVKEKRNLKGKNPLPICRVCFNYNFKIPVSGGSSNKRQQGEQQRATTKRHLEQAVSTGRRKARTSKT